MTTDTTEYSMDDLAKILSALDGQRRNPCTKKAAIKAITKKAEALGLTQDEIFDASAALLGGQTAEEWRVSLIGEARAEEEAEEAEEETIKQIRAKQDRVLATIARLDAEDAAEDEADEPAEPKTEEPGEPALDDEPAEPVEADTMPEAATPKRSRENSKQARVIEMLRRPEGATIEQIAEEMGWQKHTVRAFVSATLGKKLGLNVTSGKIDGKRTYRIED